jgi:predicted transcriptional regulator
MERGEVDPRASTIEAVRRVLEKGGIIFIAAGDRFGEGVRAISPPG